MAWEIGPDGVARQAAGRVAIAAGTSLRSRPTPAGLKVGPGNGAQDMGVKLAGQVGRRVGGGGSVEPGVQGQHWSAIHDRGPVLER